MAIRSRFAAWLIAATALLSLLSAPVNAEDTLVVELSLPSRARLGEPVEVAVEIRNAGAADVQFADHPGWDAAGGLVLTVQRVGGRPVSVAVESTNRDQEGRSRAPSTLAAQQAIGLFRNIGLAELPVPGRYVISVELTDGGRTFRSNAVEIVVDD